jgi:hypothetical protein
MAKTLNRLLTGDLSHKPGGFLLRLPEGYTGRGFLIDAAQSSYGGEVHPDLKIIDTEKSIIPVDEIRESRGFLSTSPISSQFKTLLVISAERMNSAAANAFLKVLEEPGKSTRIILATDRPWSLPATILSRCEKYIETPSQDAAIDEVRNSLENETEDQVIIKALMISQNHPSSAREIIEFDLEKWLDGARKWISHPEGAQPVLKAVPKKAPSMATLMRLLQQSIAGTIIQRQNCDTIPQWSVERAEAALSILSEMSRGCDRPGIDWKTRLHATLSCLAHAK